MKCPKRHIFFLFVISLPVLLNAVDVPPMRGRVNDTAGVLTAVERQELEGYLESLEAATGAQVAVLTIPSLQGDSLEDFSIQVVDRWQLGQADRDNGVLLLVSLQERQIRIEVGYGLEGSLTDAKSGFIIRNHIVPFFREGDFSSGILRGVQSIGGVVSGGEDITPRQLERSASSRTSRSLPINFFIILFVILLNSFGRIGRRGGLFRMLFLGSMLNSASRHRGGGFGGGWSSRGGFGGGGGFSGGGGGFGGGGASGGW